ncbi:MAG: hypothetical protein LBI03_03545 [Clostridiales bacterium]|nr:hypothetical protein [Clostridiales bacterium]
MKKFYSLLNPFQRRLRKEALLATVTIGLAIGIIVAAGILVFTKLAYHTAGYGFAAIIGVTAAILASILYYMIWRKPRWSDTTMKVDALGLEERVTTMFALSDEKSLISKLQRNDTLSKLSQVKPKQMKINIPFRQMLAVIISLAIFAAALLIPVVNATEPDPAIAAAVAAAAAEQQKIIEELNEELQQDVNELDVNDDVRGQLNDVIDDLKQDLPSYDNYVDKIARISKTSDQIDKISKNMPSKNKIGESLTKQETTKELGNSILNNNAEEIKAALEDLKNQTDSLSDESYTESLENLANDLRSSLELAKEAGVDPTDELYKALENLADSLEKTLAEAEKESEGEAVKNNEMSEQVDDMMDKALDDILKALDKQNENEEIMEKMQKQIEEAKDKLAKLGQEEETAEEDLEGKKSSETPKKSDPQSTTPGESLDTNLPGSTLGGGDESGLTGKTDENKAPDSEGSASDSPSTKQGTKPGEGSAPDSQDTMPGEQGEQGLQGTTPGSQGSQGSQGTTPGGEGGIGSGGNSGQGSSGGGTGSGTGSGTGGGNPVYQQERIYDPDSGKVPYDNVYDEYYADVLAGINKDSDSKLKDTIDDYFKSLK